MVKVSEIANHRLLRGQQDIQIGIMSLLEASIVISEAVNASKSSTGSSTRQGKCFKKCTNCSTMARSNRQKYCRLCGPETMWSARVRRSVRRARNRPVSLFTNLQAQTRRIQHTGPVRVQGPVHI